LFHSLAAKMKIEKGPGPGSGSGPSQSARELTKASYFCCHSCLILLPSFFH